MMIKMIALDLDGTLLTSQKTIDEETKQKLLEASKRGIIITIATGRDKGGIQFVIDPLELEYGHHYIAGVNGQIIYDFKKKEYIVDHVFGNQEANQIMHLAKQMKFEVICCCGYDHYDYLSHFLKLKKRIRNKLFGEPMDFGFREGKRRFIFVHDENFEITQDINKFVLIQTAGYFKKHLPRIKQELNDYEILSVGDAWVEIMPKGVNKGKAIKQIADQNNIKRDEILAFGDAENDLSMMQSVTYGIAMGNAMEIVKQHAYAVTDTNDQKGIAKALDKYVFQTNKESMIS